MMRRIRPWPFGLQSQPDISGECVHRSREARFVSDQGSEQSFTDQNTTHCMTQDINNHTPNL
ncbi:hypothetical protein JOQ06_019161, partial [Pogonophryne albipinna]